MDHYGAHSMDLNLTGRKALVTGASQGIGRAIALELAGEGCDLVLAARSAENLQAVKAAIGERHNVAVELVPGDLSLSENQQALARDFPDVELLINNAGAIPGGTLLDIDEARWREAWDLKVFGYINITRAFYGLMKKRGDGTIINIIGTGGERTVASYICGAVGNAALMAFSRALGGASADDGIRVVAINPGPVSTDRLVGLMKTWAEERFGDAEEWQKLAEPMPFGRPATPEEIGHMVAFLASDLSAYTSGTVVSIDGGGVHRGGML